MTKVKQKTNTRNSIERQDEECVCAPRFSVLIPCYNVESYIYECISSVVVQTFNDWEIVAVDDGSTDGTGEILDALSAEVGEKLSVVHTVNNGQLLARREAVRHAKGDYTICLDSDDTLRHDALAVINREVERYPGSLIQFKYSRSNDFSGGWPDYHGAPIGEKLDVSWLRKQVCTSSAFNNLWGKAIPSPTINAEDDFSELRYVKNGEDLLQLLPIMDVAESVVLIDEPLYFYRPNDASITHTFNPGMYRSVKTVNACLRSYVDKWGDEELVALLDRRWANSIFNLLRQLRMSGYSFGELCEALSRLREDDWFDQAWLRSRNMFGGRQRLLLDLFYSRKIRQVALCIRLASKK